MLNTFGIFEAPDVLGPKAAVRWVQSCSAIGHRCRIQLSARSSFCNNARVGCGLARCLYLYSRPVTSCVRLASLALIGVGPDPGYVGPSAKREVWARLFKSPLFA